MIPDDSRHQECREVSLRVVRASVLSVDHLVPGKHLLFRCSIASNENQLMIDNGSEAQFLHESFARKRKLETIRLKKRDRVRLELGDGKVHQIIDKAVIVPVRIGDHEEKLFCYLADIGNHTLIIGDGWLQEHNPHIDWVERTMTFSNRCVSKGCAPRSHSVSKFESTILEKETTASAKNEAFENFDIQSLTPKRFMKLLRRSGHQTYCFYPREKLNKKLDRYEKKLLTASSINAVTSDDHEKFMKDKVEYTLEELKKRVPEAYHGEIEVFMRAKADELAPHRKEDHEINLMPGIEPPFIKNYRPMSEQELTAVRKYLDEHLAKGFIRPSSSKAAAPVLLVRKPGGGLRFCVDYRDLNNITEKSRYPIPLISETLAKLAKAKWFTKLDVIHAFNRMRIKEGQEWLTAFNTRYGQFEYLVMPFGLCNAPSTFQSYINNSLREYLDYFVTAYLDDVLVFSETETEHIEQVLKVLRRLKERGLQLDIDKCEFSVSEVKYLGMFVGVNGVRMDPEKVTAILEWKTPASVKEVQSFLGFANFYRRFIERFSEKVKCLTELTRGEQYGTKGGKRRTKYQDFVWTTECQQAFEDMKISFTSAPILAHYDPRLETWVETDASDFVVSGILSQMHEGVLKPVAYFSKKMSPAECNYEIYDKELLAIVESFVIWRPELAGVEQSTKVYSDHKNLETFMTLKQLNRRQVRWAEMLAEYNFRIMYRPGKQGGKPDALTRREQDLPMDAEDDRTRYQYQVLLKENQLDDEVKQDLKLYVTTRSMANRERVEDNITTDSSDQIRDEEVEDLTVEEFTINSNDDSDAEKPDELLENLLAEAYQEDAMIQEVMKAKLENLKKLPDKILSNGLRLATGDLEVRHERLYYKTRLFIPNFDKLKLRLLSDHHNPPMQGHPGYRGMYAKMLENYFWMSMKDDCRRYATNCSTCRRSKAYNDQKQGLLAPLPIPQRKWTDLSLDFVVKLPKCHRRGRTYENILVIVDRLTKRRLYEPMVDIGTKDVLEVLKRRVFSTYGLPNSIVHDRGTQLTAHLWKRICQRLGVKSKPSSAHHPETDGQTENANKVMKNYLRAYVRHAQDDWVDYLPDAEFAVNNHTNASTGMSPFFADHGYHPRSGSEPPQPFDSNVTGRAELMSADKITARQEAMTKWLIEHLTWAQADQMRYANESRAPHPDYKIGDMVYVNTKDFSVDKQSRSLSSKNAGPWKIIRNIDNKAYELEIPEHLKRVGLTPIFHPWKLHLAPTNPFPGQLIEPGPPILIQEDAESSPHEEYEVLEIVDCRETKKYGTQYKATYIGSWDDWNANPPWQPWTDFIRAKEEIRKFHTDNKGKPNAPKDVLFMNNSQPSTSGAAVSEEG